MRATYESSIKLSVERVAESVISVYNLHNNQLRNTGEERANDGKFVAFNGPDIGEAEGVLKQALDDNFKSSRTGWHFTQTLLSTV